MTAPRSRLGIIWAGGLKLSSQTQTIVLLYLVDFSDKIGVCRASSQGIARSCRITKRSVLNAIQDLEDRNLITVRRKQGARSAYHLNPKLNKLVNHDHQLEEINAQFRPLSTLSDKEKTALEIMRLDCEIERKKTLIKAYRKEINATRERMVQVRDLLKKQGSLGQERQGPSDALK